MRRDPLAFSVVIPCRNEAATLKGCLDALQEQDFPPERFEIVLVDGGSTDGSRDFARRAGARVLVDGGRGPSGARNVGIRAARAPLVAFTDADCVPRHDWLTRYAEVFAEDPSLAGAAGAIRLSRETLRGILEDDDARVSYRGYITSNACYRRDTLLEVGGFAEDLVCAEDYDLAWRVMDAGHRVAHDPRPVVTHLPPEMHGPLRAYFRKQFWYARNDLPSLLRALRRAREDPDASRSASEALLLGLPTAREALCAASLAAGLLLRSRPLVGLGLAAEGGAAALHVLRAGRRLGEPARILPGLAALAAAKGLARGAGTLAGLADLGRASRRRLLRPAEGVSLGPAAPLLPRPSRRPEASRA